MSSMFTIGINEDGNEDILYKELLEEATSILLEGFDTDVDFHINKAFLEDPDKVKKLCKVIEDDMTKPSVRNLLVNQLVLNMLAILPTIVMTAVPITGILIAPLFLYFTIDYSFKRHDSFIKKIDKTIVKIKKTGNDDQYTKKRLDDLYESKKILIEAKSKYKTLEDKEKEDMIGFVLKKYVHLN